MTLPRPAAPGPARASAPGSDAAVRQLSRRRLIAQAGAAGMQTIVVGSLAALTVWQAATLSPWSPAESRLVIILVACSTSVLTVVFGITTVGLLIAAELLASWSERRARAINTAAAVIAGLHLAAAVGITGWLGYAGHDITDGLLFGAFAVYSVVQAGTARTAIHRLPGRRRTRKGPMSTSASQLASYRPAPISGGSHWPDNSGKPGAFWALPRAQGAPGVQPRPNGRCSRSDEEFLP